VELFEQIRREYEFGVGTIAGVSRKLGVHRRLVREALSSAVPAGSKPQQRRLRKLAAAAAFIDMVLLEDRRAPPKQRHTAHRIWQRLCVEVPGFSVGERSVRGYVRRRRQQLGLLQREVFVPQSYDWGVEAQCDWYEAWAVVGGERIKLQVFEMRSMASGGAYHRAYTHATQQAFLEAHERMYGDLVFDQAGNIYGTTYGGGSSGNGTVFELSPSNGGWTENVLYSFRGNNDGALPTAGVLFDNAGNLYGTTVAGGINEGGTVYELTHSVSGWTETILYDFNEAGPSGYYPFGGLIFDSSGNLYGTTSLGGVNGGGTPLVRHMN